MSNRAGNISTSCWEKACPPNIKEYFKRTNPPIIFLGAGFSKEAVPPLKTSNELCSLIKRQFKIPDNGETLTELLQYVQNSQAGSKKYVIDWLKKNLRNGKSKPGGAHHLLLHLPCSEIITTNYDQLLQDAALNQKIKLIPIDDPSTYRRHVRENRNRSKIVGMIHGSFESEDNIVATTDDYIDNYAKRGNGWTDLISEFFREKNIIFIGYSLRDFTTWTTLISVLTNYRERMLPHLMVSPISSNYYSDFWKKYGVLHVPLKAHEFLIVAHEKLGTLNVNEGVAVSAAASCLSKTYEDAIIEIQKQKIALQYPTVLLTAQKIISEASNEN